MNYREILKTKQHHPESLELYVNFIDECSNKIYECYTETHHICPKASDLFPEYSNLKKFPWNSIRLSYEDHVKAHTLLFYIFGEYYESVIYPCRFMDNMNEDVRISMKDVSSKRAKNTVVSATKESNEGYKRIDREEFHKNRHLYIHPNENKIYVTDKLTNTNKIISTEEFHKNRHLYTVTADSTVTVIDKRTHNYVQISTEEFHKNREFYETHSEKYITVILKSTNNKIKISLEEFHKNRELYTSNTDNKVVVKIKNSSKYMLIDKYEYSKNKRLYEVAASNHINAFSIKSGSYEYVNISEFYKNRELYKSPNEGYLTVTEILSGNKIKILSTEYDSTVHAMHTTGMVACTIKSTNESCLIPKEEFHKNRHMYLTPMDGVSRTEETKQKLRNFSLGKTRVFNINTKSIEVIASEEFHKNKGSVYISTSSNEYRNNWKKYVKNI